MMKELDTVVLTADLPDHALIRGDLGTVALVHPGGGYEVEFMTLDGETLAVVSLFPNQVRPWLAVRSPRQGRSPDAGFGLTPSPCPLPRLVGDVSRRESDAES